MMFKRFYTVFIGLALCTASWAQVSINGFKYVVLTSKNDYLGIKEYAESLLQKEGLKVISNPGTIDPQERLKTFVLGFEYWDKTSQMVSPKGCRIGVLDLTSNRVIAERTGGSTWGGLTNRGVAESAFKDAWGRLKFKGFKESDHIANLKELFPARPKVTVNIEAFKKIEPTNALEGIWSFDNNAYQILITKDESGIYGDFLGVVLNTDNPIWEKDEVKFEFRSTAADTVFTGNFYRGDKTKIGATFMLKGAVLEWQAEMPNGQRETMMLIRNWPKGSPTSGSVGAANSAALKESWTGSGFLLSEGGLIATNHHVAAKASSLKVLFPKAGKEFTAKLVLKDPNNDLAILQLEGFTLAAINQSVIPYGFKRTRTVALGDSVFTIGFPLSNLLGQNAKFANGTISSKSGAGDDMVHLQINAPIQPGNSGSPLFDAQGNVVGVVVASLNAEWMQKRFGVLPQNVNFAVKSDYLLNLTEMLPNLLRLEEAKEKATPERIEPFICLISAQ